MKTKVAIIKKLDSGEKMVNVARTVQYESFHCWHDLQEQRPYYGTCEECSAYAVYYYQQETGKLIEETEKLLSHWMEHQWQRHVRFNLMLIQKRAKSLFEDLKAKAGESAEEGTFAASHGWLQRLKKRANLRYVFVSGEAASADEVAAKKFPNNLKEIIDAGGYAPQQTFNVDETGLFWKKCMRKSILAVKKKDHVWF